MKRTIPYAAGLAVAGLLAMPGCRDKSEDIGVTPKVVDQADNAAGDLRATTRSMDAPDDRAEATSDVRHSIDTLKDDLEAIRTDALDFINARDRVVAQIQKHVSELSAQGSLAVASHDDREELAELRKDAMSKVTALAKATAENWDDLRDEAFEAVEEYNDKVESMGRDRDVNRAGNANPTPVP